MDILYQLPFPKEVCSKIFMYACKSRHCDLSVAILKKIIRHWDVSTLPSNIDIRSRGSHLTERQLRRRAILIASARRRLISIYNELIEKDNITLNDNRCVIKLSLRYISFAEKLKVIFEIAHLMSLPNLIAIDLHDTCVTGTIEHLETLQNLTEISISRTAVTGDIVHLKSLHNLTEIDFYSTGVTGDIVHLESLPKLTVIRMSFTGVTGDIVHLKSLPKLTTIWLGNTDVYGDIAHLKSLPKLRSLYLKDTYVYGDEDEFNEYRQIESLSLCDLDM